MAKCCCQLQFDIHSVRGIVWQHEASTLHVLFELTMAAMWRPESLGHISRTAAELHEVLLFIEWTEQSSDEIQLREEGLAIPIITGSGNKECTALSAGRIQQHFADLVAYQTGINEGLCQGYGSDRVHIQVLHWEITRNQCCKNQRGCFHLSTDAASSSDTVWPNSHLWWEEDIKWFLWLLAAYFLGSTKADNHEELVEILLLSFPKLDQDICSYIIFLYHHQYVCPDVCGIEWRAWQLFSSWYLGSGEHFRANGARWWLWTTAGLVYKRQAKRWCD